MFSSSPLPIIPPSPVAPHFSEPPSEPLVPLLPLLASPVHHRHPSSPPPQSSIINYNNNHNGSSTSSSILCNNINSAPTFDASWGNMSSSHASPTLPVSYGMPHVYQLRRSSSIDHGLTMDAEIGKHHPQPPHLHHLHHHVGDVRDVVVQNTSMDNESDECASLSADSSGISTNQRTSTDASRTPDVSDTQMHVEDLLFPSHSMKMEATHASHLHPPQTPPPLRRSPLRRASLRREQSFPRDHMTESSNLLSPNASILVQERQQQHQQHHHPAHNVPRPPAWCGGLPPSVPVPSSLKTLTRLNLSVTWASDVDGLEERNKARRRTSTLEAEQKEQRMLQHLREEEVRQREDGLVHGISLTGQPEVLQRPANHGDWGLASFGTE